MEIDPEFTQYQSQFFARELTRRASSDSVESLGSTLEPLRGSRGTLVVELLDIDSLGGRQQHLVVAAVTDDGQALPENDPEKLLFMIQWELA